MPEAADDVTVKTRFASAQALMSVVAMGIERGALRLPATIAAGRTFQIALLTATGEVAVRGSAEAVRQEGGTTLVRFLSATDDGGDKDAWIDLDDAVVNVPAALMQPRGPLPDTPGRLRARARDRSDWVGALGTPLPPEPARPGTPPRRAIVPPLPAQARPAAAPAPASIPDIPPLQAESRAPQPRSAVDLPELAPVAAGSQRLPVPPPAPTPVRLAAPLVAPAPPSAVAPPSATAHVAPPVAAPPVAAPPIAAPPIAAPPIAAGPAPLPTGTTLPPPLMAVFAAPGAGYYMAPAPAWPSETGGEGRARPTTLPPGWGAEQGRMWIPVMDPAAMPMVAPPAVAAPTTAAAPVTTRAARGVLIASVVIATAGAAVAVSAVLWARSVSATRAAPPAVAAAPTPVAAAPTPVAAAPTPVAAAPAPTPAPPVAAAPAPTPAPPVAAVEPPPPTEPAAAAPPVAAIEPPPAPAAAPAAAPADCRLAVTTSADRVGVFVDGQKRGETPATIALPCAATTVVLRHPRYDEQVRHLDADAARGALHVIMTRPRAQLRIVTRPSGAIVQIDGRTVGRAPLTTTVDGFERARVTLSAPGMHTEDRRVYAKAGTTMVNVTLKKQ